MATAVERAAYKLPEGSITLAGSYQFKDDLSQPHELSALPEIARGLGFLKIYDLPTNRSRWEVFDRPNYEVPNFPDGATQISSTLAVYGHNEGQLTHAVLRTSTKPYRLSKFIQDVVAVNNHFVERPRIFGYPSQELTRMRHWITFLVVGTVVGSAADYFFNYSLGDSIVNLGAIAGEIGGPVVFGALWQHSEKRAKRSISDLKQYSAGQSARAVLLGERYHKVTVDMQRELYVQLQQVDPELTPDQFLENIYGQIPNALVAQRRTEVEQAGEGGNSLPKLIAVSNALRSFDSYF